MNRSSRLRASSLTVGVLAALASCVSTGTTVLNPAAKRSAISPDQVVIYTSAAKVPSKYDEIAILSSQGDGDFASDDMFYKSMRQEAAKIGANGVIISPIQDPTTGQKVGSAVLGALLIPTTMGNRKTQAMAIYVYPAPASADQIAAELAKATRVESSISDVTAGIARARLLELLGEPESSDTIVDHRGVSTETARFIASGGARYVVTLTNGVVSSVARR